MRPEDIELSRRYTDILRVRGNAERTIDNYIYAVRGFAQFLGERPLSSATADDIMAHQSAIKASGRSDSCVRVATYALRGFLERVLEREDAKLAKLPRPREPKRLPLLHMSVEHRGQRPSAHPLVRRPHRTPERRTSTTRSTSSRWDASVNWPAVLTNNDWLAVNSFPGRAKLSRPRPPDPNEVGARGTAARSPYGLLVTWHRTQSTPPARARMTAGRNLDAERSEKGKRTKTTIPG